MIIASPKTVREERYQVMEGMFHDWLVMTLRRPHLQKWYRCKGCAGGWTLSPMEHPCPSRKHKDLEYSYAITYTPTTSVVCE